VARRPSRTPIGLAWSTPRFGGSGPCIVKAEQHFHFAFFDKWLFLADMFFLYYKIISVVIA
jgi:hypothetical protein